MMGEVIRVSGRAADVGDFLKEAMLSQRFADVALCCPGGQRFLAHRLVLSAASPYLQNAVFLAQGEEYRSLFQRNAIREEVLLAHSKSAAHCEPITVILAEVEAPELAALLGFVYTGSATVPRVRLDAFLRAAEALRIQLPPVPVVMTCGDQADCKLEDVKDVKVSPKYLQCDQYPSSDRWCRSARPSPYEEPYERKESCARIFPPNDTRDIPRDSRMLHELDSPVRSAYAATCASAWPLGGFMHQDRAMGDPAADKDHVSTTGRPAHELPDKNHAMVPVGEPPFNVYQSSTCLPPGAPVTEGYGALDPLERIRTGYERVQVNCATGKLADEDTSAAASGEFCGRTRDDCTRDCPYPGRMQSSSLPCAGRTRSYERSDYGQAGEDLSCGESCCRWRTARRHVANRVTASPWRQIVRPHHSPRTRPAVMPAERQVDEMEVQEKALTPEPPRSTIIPMSPRLHSPRSAPRSDGLYSFEVPNNCEMSFNGDARPREMIGGPEAARVQEIYRSPLPFAPSGQLVPLANALRSNEPPPPPPPPFQNANGNESVIANAGKSGGSAGGYATSQSTPQQTPTKPELSHPISRLCDTIDSDDKREISLTSETASAEKSGDERIARIFVNSDNNNNTEAIVSTEVPARGRPADDHRCDQCGKTFVTRASLKVHSRTHSGEKPFRCADCGKQFSQLRNYKYHRSVHEGTREFAATCPECGKYFNDRGYLSSHMKIHRNRKEYGCAECGKSFNQRVAYNMHVRIHTGVKPHQCEQCGKAFSRKMLLKQHLRTHSGERPYQCQVCQKAFADRSNMTLHTRLHSGLKPYQCTLCSKAFTKKHHLKTHLNYHTGTKPYSCPNCGLRFSQSSNMRTHFKKCSVNNPAGATKARDDAGDRIDADGNAVMTGQVAGSPADTLTPPNSDQESSILTPISKNVVAIESNA